MTQNAYTIKHVLNRNLKSIDDPKNPNIKFYPVYGQLIYKRKNYLFKSIIESRYTDLKYLSIEDMELQDMELGLLRRIIDFEIERNGDRFDVPGFADKYSNYRKSVVDEAERLLIGNLEEIVYSRKSRYRDILNYRFSPRKFTRLLEAIKVLIPELVEDKKFKKCEIAASFWTEYKKAFPKKKKYNLMSPMVIDWIIDDHKHIMTNIIKYKEIDDLEILYEYLDEFDSLMKAVTIGV